MSAVFHAFIAVTAYNALNRLARQEAEGFMRPN
jgi:hypothetical protein